MTLASCSGQVVHYDRKDGRRVWVYDVKADGNAQSFHGEMARIEQDLLVATDPAGGMLYRFNERTGDVRWRWPSGSGISSDILVSRGRVFVVTLANELVAIDPSEGTERWRTDAIDVESWIPGIPSPLEHGEHVLFPRKDGRITAHDPADGTVAWTLELGAVISTDPIAVGSMVVVGLEDARWVRFDPDDGSIVGELLANGIPTYRWFEASEDILVGHTGIDGSDRMLVGVSAVDLTEIWAALAPDSSKWTTAQPAVTPWGILAGTNEPALYAFDPATGEELWREDIEVPPRTIAVAGEALYIGSFDGTLLAIRRIPGE